VDDRIIENICCDTGKLKFILSAALRKAGSGVQPLSERASGEHWRERMCFNLRRFLRRETEGGVATRKREQMFNYETCIVLRKWLCGKFLGVLAHF
jgi:hypothetical protein